MGRKAVVLILLLIWPVLAFAQSANTVLMGQGAGTVPKYIAVPTCTYGDNYSGSSTWACAPTPVTNVTAGSGITGGGAGPTPSISVTDPLVQTQPISVNPSLGQVMTNGNPVRQYTVATLPQYSQVVLADTPGGYWRLGEAAGNFTDSSGNANTGTASGAGITYSQTAAITDEINTSIRLTSAASGDYTVATAASLPGGDTFSLEIWIKRATTGATMYMFYQKANGFSLGFDAATNDFFLAKIGVAVIATSTTAVTDTTTWHHIVCTKTGATVHLYLDKIDVTGAVTNQTIAPVDASLWVGSTSTPSQFFNGFVDEVAVYTTVLSSTRVTAHYNEGIALKNGRIGYATNAGAAACPIVAGGGGTFAFYSAGQWCGLALP